MNVEERNTNQPERTLPASPDEQAIFWAMLLSSSKVPPHLHDGVIRYLARRIRPGSFLTAVLENNFSVSLRKADPLSRACLLDLLDFLAQHAPCESWGSEDAVAAWVKGPVQP